jgi:hypothetical protein
MVEIDTRAGVRYDDVVGRALERACAAMNRLSHPRRLGDGRWTATALAAGLRRIAVTCSEDAIAVGARLVSVRGLPPECRKAVEAYCRRASRRLRHHSLELVGDEALLVGILSCDAGERRLADLVTATIKVCELLAGGAAGLCDARVAREYVNLDGQGGDASRSCSCQTDSHEA